MDETVPVSADGAAPVEAFGYQQELKRSLTLVDLLVYGLVFISPTAPFPVFGIIYNASHGMVPLVYAVGLVAMLFAAFSYMTMSRAFPVAGSVYTYASRTIGEAAGFFAGWGILLDYILQPTLIYVICAIAVQVSIPDVPRWVWVVALLGFSTAVNYFGIEMATRVNTALLAFQLFMLALFLVLAGIAFAHGVNGAHLSLTPLFNAKYFSPALIFRALSLAVLSFLGFDAISTLAEETKGGAGVVGRATILSLCLAAFLFVLQTYVGSLFVLDHASFATGTATDQAFYTVAQAVGGEWYKKIASGIGVLCGGVPAALTAQAATSRLIYGMARDRKLPHVLAHVHARTKVPDIAIFVVAAVTLVLGIFLVDKLELLTSMVSFGALLGFLLLHCSVVVHGVRAGKMDQWLRHLVSPVIGFLIIAYVLWNTEDNAKIAGGAWLAAGVVFLIVLKLMGRPTALEVNDTPA